MRSTTATIWFCISVTSQNMWTVSQLRSMNLCRRNPEEVLKIYSVCQATTQIPLPVTLLRTYYVPVENDGGQNVITYTLEKGAAVPSTLKMTTLVKNYVEAEHGLELDSLKATTTSEGSKATYIAVFGGAEVTVEVVEAK